MGKSRVRLSEAVAQYLAQRAADCAPTTVKADRDVLRRLVATLGDRPLHLLQPGDLTNAYYGPNGFAQQHRTRDRKDRPPVSATTLNYYRSRHRAFFDFCARTWPSHVRVDLMRDIRKATTERKERYQPGPNDLREMLGLAADPRDRALLATVGMTGLRRGDLLALRLRDVDLATMVITTTISKSRTVEQVPLPEELVDELKTWRTAYARALARVLQGDDYLFPASTGNRYSWRVVDGINVRENVAGTWDPTKPMTKPERVVQDVLRRMGRDPRGEGLHTLRRGFGRWLYDREIANGHEYAGRLVQAALHHKNFATTEGYLGISAERQRLDASVRGRPWFPTAPTEARVVPLTPKAT